MLYRLQYLVKAGIKAKVEKKDVAETKDVVQPEGGVILLDS